MKKILISLLSMLPLLLLPLDANADKDKGPSDRAYDRANDNASFKRDDDEKKHKKKDKKDDKDHKVKKKDKDDRDDEDKKKDKKKDKKDDKD
jgi:E3 ubiquitin-protein ligase RBBP6